MDRACRPLFVVPLTVGYVRAINEIQKQLRDKSRAGEAITQRPFLVITSMHDDVLHGDEMALAAHAIGPSRTLVQLCHARHDVLVSADRDVVTAALRYLGTWLTSQGLHELTPAELSTPAWTATGGFAVAAAAPAPAAVGPPPVLWSPFGSSAVDPTSLTVDVSAAGLAGWESD